MTDDRHLEAVPLPARRTRTRSTVPFPYCDLALAETVARHVLDSGGQSRPEQLGAWLGHSTLNSGAFRNKLAAAGQFGLIEATRNRVAITSLGSRILEDTQRRQARVDSFLNVELYSRIFDKHRGSRLPSPIGLEQEMIQAGVTRTQARFARQVFARSAGQAGFFEVSDSRMVLPKGSHLPLAGEDPERATVIAPKHDTAYPKLIEAILQEAPWERSWSKPEFEEWAELFVRASRLHFGLRDEA
ncbi:MAG: hypothetical protein ACT4OM_02815 [Actinomycetota bacterium]